MKIETPMLRRLGPVPFWRGETRCLDALERIYRRAMARANMLQYPDNGKSKMTHGNIRPAAPHAAAEG